jgi:hypothetical protein
MRNRSALYALPTLLSVNGWNPAHLPSPSLLPFFTTPAPRALYPGLAHVRVSQFLPAFSGFNLDTLDALALPALSPVMTPMANGPWRSRSPPEPAPR